MVWSSEMDPGPMLRFPAKLKTMAKVTEEIKARRRAEVVDAKTLVALYAIARRRNYKPVWAERLWNARQSKATKNPGAICDGVSEFPCWAGL